jgi:hypothetical protein
MSDHLIRMRTLDIAKKDFERYREKGEIEMANSTVRNASFICNQLGINVIDAFTSLTMVAESTASIVKDLRETVEKNRVKCPHCAFTTVLGVQSMRAHIGRMHSEKKNLNTN